MHLIKLIVLTVLFAIAACSNTTRYHSTTHDTQTQGAAGNLDANGIEQGKPSASPNTTSTPMATPR